MRRCINAARLTTRPPNATAINSNRTRPAFSLLDKGRSPFINPSPRLSGKMLVFGISIFAMRSLSDLKMSPFKANSFVPGGFLDDIMGPAFHLFIDSPDVLPDNAQTAQHTTSH